MHHICATSAFWNPPLPPLSSHGLFLLTLYGPEWTRLQLGNLTTMVTYYINHPHASTYIIVTKWLYLIISTYITNPLTFPTYLSMILIQLHIFFTFIKWRGSRRVRGSLILLVIESWSRNEFSMDVVLELEWTHTHWCIIQQMHSSFYCGWTSIELILSFTLVNPFYKK